MFARKHMIKQEILCIDQHHHMDWWVREAALLLLLLFADASDEYREVVGDDEGAVRPFERRELDSLRGHHLGSR